jgi:hypothetical protein
VETSTTPYNYAFKKESIGARASRMKFSKTARIIPLLLIFVVFVAFSSGSLSALPGDTPPPEAVYPPRVEATLPPGGSLQVTKIVNVPDKPPKLDLFLIVDLSGSYTDDLPNIRTLAPGLFDDVQLEIPDARFGLGSFIDFPFIPWGNYSYGDYAYRLEQDMTTEKTTWLAAIDAMSIGSGAGGRESQYEALYQAATGAGREMPLTTDGDFDDRGEIAPGQSPTFRPDAIKVIALTTDAAFHTVEDEICMEVEAGCPFLYPGALRDDTVAALQAAGIKVIGIKGLIKPDQRKPDLDEAMDDLAQATGGVVKTTDESSSELVEAILSGIQELRFNIRGEPAGCDPLVITFDPPVHENIRGGETVYFEEHITVPADIAKKSIQCAVEFKAGDTIIGIQELLIEIEQPTAIDLISFAVKSGIDGTAIVTWETGTEIDNAGFNLYRAASLQGPWRKINNALIAAKGDPVSGDSYIFIDTPGLGTFYYQLEDVDYFGVSTLHGPVMVELDTANQDAVSRIELYLPIISK